MTIEKGTLVFSMIINLLVSFIKVGFGFICNSNLMIADGIHSLSDFITDIVALIGMKYSSKRANKEHPSGYGRTEYLVDMFISTVIFILGIYTLVNSFSEEPVITNPKWIIVIIITIICKYISSRILIENGKKYQSTILTTSGKESRDDIITSIGVVIIILLSTLSEYIRFFKYIDTLGSVIIGALIIKTSVELFKESFNFILGKVEVNKEIEHKIKEIVENNKDLEYKNMYLERNGNYYVLELYVYVLRNIKVYKLINIETNIRNQIKKLSYRIKYVDVNIIKKNKEQTKND